MCIISGPVERVSMTNIFVADVVGKYTDVDDAQLTVYTNDVKLPNGKSAAMILPFVQGRNFELLNFLSVPKFFKHLAKDFEQPRYRSARGGTLSRNSAATPLEVFEVGSYDVSVVPSVDDFHRLQAGRFGLTIDPNVLTLLQTHYADNFGFVVCRLRQSAAFHPIAYVSNKRGNQIFVPTKHFHDHGDGSSTNLADWDHSIYTHLGSGYMNNLPGFRYPPQSRVARNMNVALELRYLVDLKVDVDTDIRRIKIDHYENNHDIVFWKA